AVVGGCWPMFDPGAPGVGPDPASCAVIILVRLSISLAHWPAPAALIGSASSAQLPNTNAIVFMSFTSTLAPSRRVASRNQLGAVADVPATEAPWCGAVRWWLN